MALELQLAANKRGRARGAVSERPTLALFDFDGTITNRHTFWRYLREVAGAGRFWGGALALLPTAAAVLIDRTTVVRARELLLEHCLGGTPVALADAVAQRFATQSIPRWIRPGALRQLEWHASRGHTTVLVSNSAENYLTIWGRRVGFDHVLGTRFAAHDGRLSGRFEGACCVGPEKVRRVGQVFGPLDGFEIYAYGDSSGDRAMLDIADHRAFRPWQDVGSFGGSDVPGMTLAP